MTSNAPPRDHLSAELLDALRAPPPRSGDAFAQLLRAQRMRWTWVSQYALCIGSICLVVLLWGDFFSQSLFACMAFRGAIASSPFMFLHAALEYMSARRLARHGLATTALIHVIRTCKGNHPGLCELDFESDAPAGVSHRARGVILEDFNFEPGATATGLFLPSQQSLFAWGPSFSGAAQQARRAALPRARIP